MVEFDDCRRRGSGVKRDGYFLTLYIILYYYLYTYIYIYDGYGHRAWGDTPFSFHSWCAARGPIPSYL